jgi:malate dehydrogenase (oxaloacetate-decarboxylating)
MEVLMISSVSVVFNAIGTPLIPAKLLNNTALPSITGCKDIYEDKRKVYDYTIKGNTVAVITDGTAVLGLGNIGPEASIPVMD